MSSTRPLKSLGDQSQSVIMPLPSRNQDGKCGPRLVVAFGHSCAILHSKMARAGPAPGRRLVIGMSRRQWQDESGPGRDMGVDLMK